MTSIAPSTASAPILTSSNQPSSWSSWLGKKISILKYHYTDISNKCNQIDKFFFIANTGTGLIELGKYYFTSSVHPCEWMTEIKSHFFTAIAIILSKKYPRYAKCMIVIAALANMERMFDVLERKGNYTIEESFALYDFMVNHPLNLVYLGYLSHPHLNNFR